MSPVCGAPISRISLSAIRVVRLARHRREVHRAPERDRPPLFGAKGGESRGWVLYRITSEGNVHPQRRESLARAELPPLMVRSDRSFRVLSFIAERNEVRIKEVRDELGIPHNSMNALMQYLKRRGVEFGNQVFRAQVGIAKQHAMISMAADQCHFRQR